MNDTKRVVLTDHVFPGASPSVTVQTLDSPGSGGAHHEYLLQWEGDHTGGSTVIHFQNGPIAEAGANGLTNEALLAIVIHRLRCFQEGPFSTRQNAVALTRCEEALMWLHARTHERLMRGVEGTHAK